MVPGGEQTSSVSSSLRELPDECWELIFSHLDDRRDNEWQALSLACRRFLLISNRGRPSMAICSMCPGLPGGLVRILQRFKGLTDIDLSNFHGNLARPLLAISESCPQLRSLSLQGQKGLPMEALLELGKCCTNLKSMNCSKLHLLQDDDVKAIAISFSQLEILDISYPQVGSRFPHTLISALDSLSCSGMVLDTGMEVIAARLPHLRSLNISGQYMLSDSTLKALALGCQELEELSLYDCSSLTDAGLELLGHHCKTMKKLDVNGQRISSLGIEIFLRLSQSLLSLDLSYMTLSDGIVFQVRDVQITIKKLFLSRCKGLTSAGILGLSSGCSQITHLNLEGAHYLTDENVAMLAKGLPDLSFICLNYCSMLTDSSFFSLLESCTRLEELDMESTGLGWGALNVGSFTTCLHLHRLRLAWNKAVGDDMVRLIGSLCPSLLCLDLSHCLLVTEMGLDAISKGCPHVKQLILKGCKKLHNLCDGGGFEELEQLDLGASGVTDSGLQNVGKTCRHLVSLGLEGCVKITESGLNKLMEDCKELKEMNLKDCQGVNLDTLAVLVFCRPSLRKLVLPSGTSEERKKRLMRHSCELNSFKDC